MTPLKKGVHSCKVGGEEHEKPGFYELSTQQLVVFITIMDRVSALIWKNPVFSVESHILLKILGKEFKVTDNHTGFASGCPTNLLINWRDSLAERMAVRTNMSHHF